MKQIELLKLVGMVIFVPIVMWLFAIQGTVNQWRECDSAEQELSRCDTVKKVEVKTDVTISLMDFIASKEVKVMKYNRYMGANNVIINELIVADDFIDLVKLIDSISEKWDISSVTFTTESTTIIIQELIL